MSIVERLQRIDWQGDRMRFNGHIFELEHLRDPASPLGDSCFRVWKTKPLIDQYIRLWSRFPDFVATGVVELGMYLGGGTAFWFEMLQPEKIIGIERLARTNPHFDRYVNALSGRLRPFWGVDQRDRITMRKLIATELGDRLNVVLDDASHIYEPTKAAFELLFPLMSPGGFYIIEDWAWAHWPEFYAAFGNARDLTELALELMEAAGTSTTGPVASVTVMQGFLCVERSPTVISNPETFSLNEWIERRPPRVLRRARTALNRVTSVMRR